MQTILEDLEDLDSADMQAIIAVQLSDLDDALAQTTRKGKAKAGDSAATPGEAALRQYRDYLTSIASILADAKLAHSIDHALEADAAILAKHLVEEETARRDREWAIRLSRGQGGDMGDIPVPVSEVPRVPGADPRLGTGYATSSGTRRGGVGGAGKATTSLVQEMKCCSCIETRFCVTAPCGDAYCHVCIRTVFRNACNDEECFPPRCHRQEIPLYLAHPFLSKEEIALFKAKKEEFTTVNRTYCYNPTCLAFIPGKNCEEDCALCGKCAQMTCVSCKKKWHGKTDCPTDSNLTATLELAVRKGWQRCRGCHALVERLFGCQHIVCKCGSEFCYRCGLKWKTCKCSDWDTRALDRRAEQLAIREVGDAVPPSRIARRTSEIRREILERHACEHDGRWENSRTGGHQCEMCYHTLPNYIWVCVGCRIQVCTRCRMNRI
ncbi:hypothetical protein K440DRAFT_616536 [Wilcoxina mikolae CBS 423.85]|nr:hypothetical protein K440DRAFT_616536 [Wilcoxina mikolae CBS 423.85]